jgi:small subunit ribosomal protein S17
MRNKTGIVISAKNDKTRVVLVQVEKIHPILRKAYKETSKFHAHDEQNNTQEGDTVQIVETRPISKKKHWKIVKVIQKGTIVENIKEEILGEKDSQKAADQTQSSEVSTDESKVGAATEEQSS